MVTSGLSEGTEAGRRYVAVQRLGSEAEGWTILPGDILRVEREEQVYKCL